MTVVLNEKALKVLADKVGVYEKAGWKVQGYGMYRVNLRKGRKEMVVKIDPDTMVIGSIM